jgi:branched-subunit amino acid transport protein
MADGMQVWLVLLIIAAGTFLLRALPLWWMQRHLQKQKSAEQPTNAPWWLTVLGPAMIAAMLGVSLLPAEPAPASLLATVAGCVATLLLWRKTRSLGWPVVVGVASYALVYIPLS